jgi:hypothetical protein
LLAVCATLTATLLASSEARAAGPTRAECIAAADDGQKLRDDGKLSAARDKFLLCAQKACPQVIAKTCSGWREDADRDMPTATFRATDERGKELLDVTLTLDAATEAQPISARATSLDPGEHVVHVRRTDGKTADEKFLLRPGEKNRMVEIRFASTTPATTAPVVEGAAPQTAAPAATGTSDGFHVPLLGWVGLGAFVAGGATTTVFAVMAKSQESDLRSRGCAPGCPSSDKDSINTKLLVANVGMGVGIVGLGVAVVSTVLANTGKKSATTGAGATTTAGSVRVDASPQGVWLSGSF